MDWSQFSEPVIVSDGCVMGSDNLLKPRITLLDWDEQLYRKQQWLFYINLKVTKEATTNVVPHSTLSHKNIPGKVCIFFTKSQLIHKTSLLVLGSGNVGKSFQCRQLLESIYCTVWKRLWCSHTALHLFLGHSWRKIKWRNIAWHWREEKPSTITFS